MKRLDVTRPINHRDIERRITPQDRGAAGNVNSCTRTYELRVLYSTTPATLTPSIRYNAVTEAIVLNGGDDAADIKAAIDAHSEFVAASVECTVEGAGTLLTGNMIVTLPSGATIVSHTASLTRVSIYDPNPDHYINICNCSGE